jgi:hypothetical protein
VTMAAELLHTEYGPRVSPYELDSQGFPSAGTLREQAQFLLQFAVLAPSTRNTQPWLFGISEYGIEVYADYSRRLPVADPGNRELLMSVGAAIMNLRVAAARYGLSCRVHYDHSGGSDRPLATITLPGASEPSSEEAGLAQLFPAIPGRRTNRAPFLLSRIPAAVVRRLEATAEGHRATLHVSVDGALNEKVADLVAAADRVLQSDAEYRKDVSRWIRSGWTESADGITGEALGTAGLASVLAPWATRVLDLGRKRAAEDRNLCLAAPGLVTIAGEDSPPSLLDCGELLERALLTLALEGVHASYFNMPVQVSELRMRLRSLLGLSESPQVLLRIGYSFSEGPRTPRRAVEDFMKHDPSA